jgi:hypothetical protein
VMGHWLEAMDCGCNRQEAHSEERNDGGEAMPKREHGDGRWEIWQNCGAIVK